MIDKNAKRNILYLGIIVALLIIVFVQTIYFNISFERKKINQENIEILTWVNKFNAESPVLLKENNIRINRLYMAENAICFNITLLDKEKNSIDWEPYSAELYSKFKKMIQTWSIYTYYDIYYVYDFYDKNEESIGRIIIESGKQ